jgi:chaperonin GroES
LGALGHETSNLPTGLEPETDLEGDEREEQQEERTPKAKPKAGSLKAQLLAWAEDINLARYLDQQTLDEIGMMVVREYQIDENSRADWVTKAKKALRFATQDAQPKQYPWPGASAVIFPLISQAALEFGARAYGAIVQNRNVVKGIVWGSDKGTPITHDGKADGPPVVVPVPSPSPPAGPGQVPGPTPQQPPSPQQGALPGLGGPPMQPVWKIAPGEKRKRADLIGEHMSWQLLEEMPEWEPQTDQGLNQMAIIGGFARKTYRDPSEDRNRSLMVSLANLVWNYHAPSFEAAPRHTEKVLLYPYQIEEMERAGIEDEDEEGDGVFLPIEYGPGGGDEGESFGFDEDQAATSMDDPDAPHLFLEQHRRWDLDDDGYSEPYTITVHKRSGKVVRIVARYDDDCIETPEDDDDYIKRIDPVDHYTLYPFLPNMDGGSYPMGFGHYLRPLNEAINGTLNQMFDAGHLQNAGGGFISDQLGIPSGQTLFNVGRYTRVTTKGQSIRDSVFPLPFQGPSPVLFQLLGVLITASEKMASIQNVLTGDASIANAPPTTVLALIEQGMKVYTAIHKRVYRAEKSELAKLFRLNRKYLKATAKYRVGDEWREVTPNDYELAGGVEPIADPTMVTDMQKLGRAQILMGFKDDPMVDQMEIRRRLFDAASIDRIDELLVPPSPAAAAAQQAAIQMEMALKQAELGRTRAAEQKDSTQAFLNLALARKNASAAEEAFISAQLDYLRLHIEAVNSLNNAALIDHKFHDTNTRAALSHAQMLADQAQSSAELAAQAGQPTPGPTGPFPVSPPGPPAAPPTPAPSPAPSDGFGLPPAPKAPLPIG